MEDTKLHIVAVPFPAQSHISAMMHLCKRIASFPHIHVSFVSVDSIHEQMLKQDTLPNKGFENIDLESIPFQWKIPNGYDAYCVANSGLFADECEKQLTVELNKFIEKLAGKVSCIVSDYFLPWTQQVADNQRIPRIVLLSGGASWACIEYHVPELAAKNHIFCKDGEDCLIDYVGGLTRIRKVHLPAYLQRTDQLWNYHGIKRSKSITRASWLLVNSFYALEKVPFDYMTSQLGSKFVPVGPLFLLNQRQSAQNVLLRAEDAKCLDWLDAQPEKSVIYISFGSIAVLNKDQFVELAEALKLCKTRFLWVIRDELVLGGIPGEYLEEITKEEQGLIVSWAPQLRVLEHKSVGSFLTHCGWNSILEGIANGVPMVGWPWAGEQNTNCKIMAEDWGIGASLMGHIRKEEIVKAVKMVMDEESGIRGRVKELQKITGSEAVQQAEENLHDMLHELRKA